MCVDWMCGCFNVRAFPLLITIYHSTIIIIIATKIDNRFLSDIFFLRLSDKSVNSTKNTRVPHKHTRSSSAAVQINYLFNMRRCVFKKISANLFFILADFFFDEDNDLVKPTSILIPTFI